MNATVAECWRYPVKSLQGHRADALEVRATGVTGDRERALIDAGTGHLLSAKRVGALLGAVGRQRASALTNPLVVWRR